MLLLGCELNIYGPKVAIICGSDNYKTDEIGEYVSALSNDANLAGTNSAWLVFGVRFPSSATSGLLPRAEHRTLVRAGGRGRKPGLVLSASEKLPKPHCFFTSCTAKRYRPPFALAVKPSLKHLLTQQLNPRDSRHDYSQANDTSASQRIPCQVPHTAWLRSPYFENFSRNSFGA